MKIERLEMKNLDFFYNPENKIFSDVSLNIPLNKTFWLHGPLGSGKASFLRLLMGLENPSNGSFFINDLDLAKAYEQDFLQYRKIMGVCFDHGGLVYNRTIEENLLLPLNYHHFCSQTEAKERVTHYLNQLKIMEFKDLRPAFVPAGVNRLVILLRSLIHFPELLLWNNPTMGLDEDFFKPVIELVREMKEHHGLKHIFIASEDFEFMNVFGFEILNFENGKITLLGQQEQVA